MTSTPPTMILLGEPRPHLGLTELDPTVSPITGTSLRRFELVVTINDDELNEQFLDGLKSNGSKSAVLTDADGDKWRVGNHSYSYGNQRQVVRHTIELIEEEQLDLAEVSFGGMSLVPEMWTLSKEGKVVTVLTTLDPETHAGLDDLLAKDLKLANRQDPDRYFPVQQVGLRDEPVLMRFGRCLWQPADEGRTRHALTLVAKQLDDDGETTGVGLTEPEVPRLKDAAVIQGRKLDALIVELRNAGILDDAAVARIEKFADEAPESAWRQFDRTNRIEAFIFD